MSTRPEVTGRRSHHLDRRAQQLVALSEGDDDDLLSTEQMAAWFGCSAQWFEIGRSCGNYGPPFVRLSPGIVRYKRAAVLRWLEQRQRSGDPPQVEVGVIGGLPKRRGPRLSSG